MKQIKLIVLMLLASVIANAQVTGSKNIPGDYPTLAAAIADLNAVGVGAGGATINLLAGNPETAPAGGYQLGSAVLNPTLTAANPLVFNGNNNVITAQVGVGTLDAIWFLMGVDRVTINNFQLTESVANLNTTQWMEWGIAFVKRQNISPVDGCQYNTIQNCTITLNKANTTSYGIYMNNHIFNSITQLGLSTVADANSYNVIRANTIQNVNSGMLLQGSTTIAYYDKSNRVGGTAAADGNIFQNFGSTAITYGIWGQYQDSLVIQNNNLNNMNGGGTAATTTQYGIYTNNNTSCNQVTIRKNTVNLTQGASGILYCIWNVMGSTILQNQLNIDSNDVKYNHTSTGSTTYGIYNTGNGFQINIVANRFENFTNTAGTGTHYLIYPAGSCYNTYNINDNKIINFTRASTSGATYGIYATGGVGSTAVVQNFLRNKIDRIFYSNVANTGALYGIYDFRNTSIKNMSLDTFVNCRNNAGLFYGIYTYNMHNGSEVAQNYFAADTNNSTHYDIWIASSSQTDTRIRDNVITGIRNLGTTSTIYPIYISGAVSMHIYRNNIYDIQSAIVSSGVIAGMYVVGGTNLQIYDNFISDLRAPAGAQVSPIYGMWLNTATNCRVYNNTINLNPVGPGVTFGATGIYYTTSITNLDLRNNIVRVNSTQAGTGFVVALRRNTGTAGVVPANLTTTSNANIYFVPQPQANSHYYAEGTVAASFVNAYNNTNDPNFNTSCGVYKGFMSPRESSSFVENNLASVGGGPKFAPVGPSYAKGNAVALPSTIPGVAPAITIPDINKDYDQINRGVPYFDCGALEFVGTILDGTGPTITYSPIANINSCGGLPIITATITDISGVNVVPGTRPRVYYKRSTNNNALVGNTAADNGWKWVEAMNAASPFAFQLNPAILFGGAPIVGDIIQYFVVAQDNVGTPNVGRNQVNFAAGYCPASVNLLPAGFPTLGSPVINSFTVVNGMNPKVSATATPVTVCNPGWTTLAAVDTVSAIGAMPTGYLTSNATSTADDELARVQILTTPLNQASDCFTTGGGAANGLPASSLNRYSNYTATAAIPTLINGTTYNFNTDLTNCSGTAYSMGVAVFIDYNRDGVIDPVTERAYGSPTTYSGNLMPTPTVHSFTVTVPVTAASGPTLMRVIVVESNPGTAISPTGTYSWGETEDYQIYLNNPNVVATNVLPVQSFSWAPAAGILTNPNKVVTGTGIVAPTTYTVTVTDGGGCTGTTTVAVTMATSVAITGVTGTTNYCNDQPSTTLTVNTTGGSSPIVSFWTGGPVVTAPACAAQTGFAGAFAPANWTTTQNNSNGTVNTGGAPANIIMTSSDGLSGAGSTNYTINMPCAGRISFNWAYSTVDGAAYDYPRTIIAYGNPQLLPGYATGGGAIQNGTATLNVPAGPFTLQTHSVDNAFGPCTTTFSNFVFTPAISGTQATVNPAPGTTIYTVTVVDPCGTTATTTISVNVTVPPPPTSVTATPASICPGATSNLSAISAGNTINWYLTPTGGASIGSSASGANFPVSPLVTTTYYASQASGPSGAVTLNYTGNIVNWTVPPGVTSVTITAKGAQGGAGGTAVAGTGGLGASMTGTFAVTPGQVLKVLVGQMGGGSAATPGGGGGGGTFVTDNLNVPLIVAGGGGGRHGTLTAVGIDANTTNNGNNGYSTPAGYPANFGTGGINGNGATTVGTGACAGNGAGLLTNGATQGCCGSSWGTSFIGNGAGGASCTANTDLGGFGGGGGGGNNGAGGGGGYSGGGGSYHTPVNGGGGGSYNIGTNQVNTVNNTGNGQVLIQWDALCSSVRVPVTVTLLTAPIVTASASPSPVCAGSPTTLTGGGAVSYAWNPGALVGSPVTANPLVATTYTVVGTDAGGCTASATVAVAVNPTPSNVITQTPAGPLACGVVPTLTAPTGMVVPPAGARYYIRDADPWGTANYTTGMNNVFGVGNWSALTYAAANPATIFVPATQFVYLEGSSGTEAGQTAYLLANLPLIETWVNNGGRLLLNRGPNTGGNTNFGFGGVTNTYPVYSNTVNVVGGHPIATGPYLPAGTGPYTGGSYGHAVITGGGTTAIITEGANVVLSQKNWGSGLVLFGGYTSPNFHNPLPNAQNLFQNWINYCANSAQGAPLNYLWAPGGAITQTISAPTTGIYTCTITQGPCSTTGTISVTVNDNPIVNASPNNASVCMGNQVTLTGTGNAVSYSWSGGINDGVAFTPALSQTYTVTGAAANGCTATSTAVVTVNPVNTGTGTATPGTICLGANTTISGSATPICAGNVSNFAGAYAPANWVVNNVNSNGTVNTLGAPASIVISSGNNLSGTPGTTGYQIPVSCSGNVTFNWSYNHADAFGSVFDFPRYTVNGGAPTNFTGFTVGGANVQAGTQTIPVNVGDVVQLQMYTIDNDPTPGFVTISNFSAPAAAVPGTVSVWDAPVGGTNLGAPPVVVTPATAGTVNYYLEVTSSGPGSCVNPVRVAIPVTVNQFTTLTATATPSTICDGETSSLSASNGVSYTWNPGALNGSPVTVTPNATTTYTVEGTDVNGCTATATATVSVNPLPTLGTTSASPNPICLGDGTDLTYVGTLCGIQNGFAGTYAPANWALSTTGNSNGTINAAGAPASIVMTSSDGAGGSGSTNWTITVPCAGTITFDWSYTTVDGANWDYPRYSINGGAQTLFNGYSTGGANNQNGNQTIAVAAGDVLQLNIYSVDNIGGSCVATITNFMAPGAIAPTITWWDMPAGGTNLGTGSPFNVTPGVTGTVNYYAQVTNLGTSCTNPTRVLTPVTVNGLPTVTATPATQTLCENGMATVAGGGAVSYVWTGGITDNTPFAVTMSNVYTVTGTDANGCSNTATAEVIMNSNPNVSGTITPATTCAQTVATPNGSGAVSYTWSGGLTDNTPFVALANATYTVTGIDANGCSATSTAAVVVNPASGILAPATTNQSQDHGDDFDINYYDASCDLIATVDDGAGGNILGLTTATVNVMATADFHNGQPYVRRWYQITPTSNGAADVILYINQSDFDDYNAAVLPPYLPLPTSGNNADPNIANIRITKNDDAGLGNNPIVITPSVNWNGTYWELSFNTPSFSQFRVHSVNPGNVPLPATITQFSGVKMETSDKLMWTTSSEQNNAYFNLQHSTDGKTYSTISKVNSKAPNGTSQVNLNYVCYNEKPVLGKNYYRLQQVDIDNNVTVHSEIVITNWGADGSVVSLYPNPTSDVLNIDLQAVKSQMTTVKVMDMSGRVVKQIDAKTVVGMNNIKVNLGEFANGMYTVQVLENNQLTYTGKVRLNK